MAAVTKRYAARTTTGAEAALAAPGSVPFNRCALQLKGNGAAATSWTATLEGSLDGANWTILATHNATDGSTQFAVDKPVIFVRANLSALTLGSATSVDMFVTAATP